MNLAWAPGNAVGTAAGGALAGAAGDAVAYGVLAGVCAVTFVAVLGRRPGRLVPSTTAEPL
jgi:hypothetical protein